MKSHPPGTETTRGTKNPGTRRGSETSKEECRPYTPPLAASWLTPFYDFSIRLFTREKSWRNRLIELAAPEPGNRILDIGCGTGTLAIWLKQRFPDCDVVGIDPDLPTLEIARRKSSRSNVDVEWIHGFVDAELVAKLGCFDRVFSSLVLHQTSIATKREILNAARKMLPAGGRFCIADYAEQKTWLMKMLFRIVVQTIDGWADTQPNADGFLTECLREVGFERIDVAGEYHTITGAISVIFAE